MPQRGKERGGGGGERRKELPVAGKRKCVEGEKGVSTVLIPPVSLFLLYLYADPIVAGARWGGGGGLVYSQGFSARRVAERRGRV